MMEAENLLRDFVDFITRQPCTEGFDQVHVIVNPVAGGFTRKKVFRSVKESFYAYYDKIREQARRFPADRILLHQTHGQGDCANIVRGLITNGRNEKEKQERLLIITFGGDGTATEAASEIHRFIERGGSHRRAVLFRLPMGTGNDGLDADTMETAFTICGSQCVPKQIPLLQIDLGSGIRKFASNIASFGLDAYVTDKTNKLKQKIPGSFYSVMVDVAALFYELSAEIEPFEISAIDEKGDDYSDRITALLLAMGVSGNRTYGGGKWVLPGHENVCSIGRMSLPRKFVVKELLYKGEHTGLDEAKLFTARELQVNFPGNILFQHDGEVIPLTPEDFPVTLKVLSPSVQVLRPEDLTILPNLRGRGE